MSHLSVSFEEVAATASALSAGRSQIADQLTALQGRVGTLVSSGFVTEHTSHAFQNAYDRFTAGARETIASLDDLSAFLTQAANTLRDVDTQLASRLH